MSTETLKIWDKAAIQELLQKSDRAVVQAIKALYERQTADEQASNDTKHHNGVGFNSRDARFLSDVAKALPRWNDRMTVRQLAVARKMLPKYWRQLLEVAQEQGRAVDFGGKKPRKPEIANSSSYDAETDLEAELAAAELVVARAAGSVNPDLRGMF